jgi:TonB family protein
MVIAVGYPMRTRETIFGRAGRGGTGVSNAWRACLAVMFVMAFGQSARADEPPSPPPSEAPRSREGAVPRGLGGAVIREAPPEEAPPPAQITPPKLKTVVNPVYPPEAAAQGLEATVILELVIDRAGKVTKATVPQPMGHGFDEAAQAAALQLQFEPATKDGKPVPAKIAYRYNFTLQKQEVVAPPPSTGNLGGTIRMAGPDSVLAGAKVIVVGPDGQEHWASTDENGKWTLEGLPPGAYRVKVAADGFSPIEATEQLEAGEATDVTYRIAAEVKGGEYEVTVQGELPPREVTKRTIERREMSRIPGTSGDALRSLQSLPGVARPPGLAGLLIVRGSSPNDTQVFVDGASIPLIYHFGGLTSALPTELLDKIDFYPSNFSARYGQLMGGIVDVSLREPDTQCYGDYGKPTDKKGCAHALLQADLIDTRALVQGRVGDWTFAAGGRRSWVDLWLKPVLESTDAGVSTAPVYYDYQLIAETHPTKTSRFSARFFGSDDRLKLLISEPFANDPGFGGNLQFGTKFYRAQALYEADLTKSVSLRAMAAVGKNSIDFGFGQLKFNLDLTSIQTRSELTFKIMRGLQLHAGLDFLIGPYDVFIRAPAPPRPGEADPGPLTTRPVQETQETATFFRPAWYGEAEIQPNRRAQLVPGLRVDYARDTGHADVAPRFTGRYDLIGGRAESDLPIEERHLRTTVKGGVGVFYQPPQPQETNAVFGTPGLLSNRAIHYTIGVEQEFTRQIELSLEGYYKDLTKLVSRTATPGGTAFDYGNQGTGSVVGMEVLAKYKPDDRFFGWLSYSLSRSVRRDNPDEAEHLFQYDQTHILTVLGSYRLGNGWEVGARFRLVSGNLATAVARPPALTALYAADAAAYAPLEGSQFGTRLPLFHQLDVRIDKGWQFRKWRLSAYLDVQNIYNNPAREALLYNYNYTAQSYQTGIPIIPSIGLRGEI